MDVNESGEVNTSLPGKGEKKGFREWQKYRWVALGLAVLGGLGPNITIAVPIPLMKEIRNDLNLDVTEYTILIAMCGIPNIVCSAGAGLLLDRLGRGPVFMTCLGILALGNVVACVGCVYLNYALLLAGGFLFSIGAQGYLVASSSLIAFWFEEKETAVALAIETSVSYIGVAAAYWTMPVLYKATNELYFAFIVTIGLTVISIIAGFVLVFVDRIARPDPSEKAVNMPPLGCSTFKMLGWGYVFLIVSYAMRVLGYNMFEFVSSEFYQDRFGFDSTTAGAIISTPYLTFAALTFPCGLLIYYIGRKPLIIGIATAVMIYAMVFMGWMDGGKEKWVSIVPFIVFSVANVFCSAALWPSIPYAVPEEVLGLAYGIMLSTLNLCIAVGPIILGIIHDATLEFDHGWAWSVAFVLVWMILGLVDSIFLIRYDSQNGFGLFTSEYINQQKKAAVHSAEPPKGIADAFAKSLHKTDSFLFH